MSRDKQVSDATIRFVLMQQLGHAIVATLPAAVLSATLNSRFVAK